MKFATVFALAIGLLAVLPYVAHRLRRRQAEPEVFPPTRLVPPAQPKARKRSTLEDRGVFALRVVALAFIAALAATPLVQCSRMSLARPNGASLALVLVLDDSLSMRARAANGNEPRFARAVRGARELLASTTAGDSVALVLAGAPVRVEVAPTTDINRVRAALDAIAVSDRATDLEAAIALAESMLDKQPQIEKRVVLLSDLADGRADDEPIGAKYPHLVVPPLELSGALADCAITMAARSGNEVRVLQKCTPGEAPRSAQVRAGSLVVGTGAPVLTELADTAESVIQLAQPNEGIELHAVLVGGDAIASDDDAPVAVGARPGVIGTYTEQRDDAMVIGSASVTDRALTALELPLTLRTLSAIPDGADDFEQYSAIIFDDPSGLTPEQRRHVARFLESGGYALIGLGPRAARAPLGYSFEPLLAAPVLWRDNPVAGLDPSTLGTFGGTESGFAQLGARSRAELSPQDAGAFRALAAWGDGAPFLLKRPLGRGELWLTTLPFALDHSELALRPGFLAILDEFASQVSAQRSQSQGEVGGLWNLSRGNLSRGSLGRGNLGTGNLGRGISGSGNLGSGSSMGGTLSGAIEVARKEGNALAPPLPLQTESAGVSVRPALAGRYVVRAGQRTEERVAYVPTREIDLRPRRVAAQAGAVGAGVVARAPSDLSWLMAALLVFAFAVELLVRLWRALRTPPADLESPASPNSVRAMDAV